ncbi:hypothetical protein LEMLEM_LOCUS20334 [Lemmus lemmus]
MQSCWYLMTRSRTVRKPSAVSKSSMPLPCSQAYTIEMAKSRSGKTVASKAENICCVAIQGPAHCRWHHSLDPIRAS